MYGQSDPASDEVPDLTPALLGDRAAAAALADPTVGPDQWVYRKHAVVAVPDMADSPVSVERWATADGSVAAAYIDGRLEVGPWMWPVGPDGTTRKMPLEQPALSYGSLSSLPGDAAAIGGFLGDTPVARDKAWHAGHAFELIAGLFQHYVLPSAVTAQLYRALSQITGVTIDVRAMDVAGQRGPGFLLAGMPGGNQEITINSRSHKFGGYQFFGSGRDITADGAWGMAILRQVLVTGPGVYP
jgi:hypothetical protein